MRVFSSMIEAVLSASGMVIINGYQKRHLNPEILERKVKESSLSQDGRKATSIFAKPGVNLETDTVYIRFPFDSQTLNTTKDAWHHTTCDVGSVLTGKLHKDYTLSMVSRNEKGQFENIPVSFQWLCPQVPDTLLDEYVKDRGEYELLSDEIDKIRKVMKDRGLLPKGSYGPPDPTKTCRVVEIRKGWNLAGLPKNLRFSWKEKTDDDLYQRMSDINCRIGKITFQWQSLMGLSELEEKQLFRALDGGLVESGRLPADVKNKNFSTKHTPEEFAALVSSGKVTIGAMETEGQLVSV